MKAQFRVVRYTAERKGDWDAFLKRAKNATFLFCRDYMDYHSQRFSDYSLMVYRDEDILAVYPANLAAENTLVSHEGLTYGGLVLGRTLKLLEALQCFYSVLAHLNDLGIKAIRHKPIPRFYNTLPADELDYAVFLLGARLYRRDCVLVINLADPLAFQKGRKSEISKAARFGVSVSADQDFRPFWEKVLVPRLASKHGVRPVHTVDEIVSLAQKFPDNIKLYSAYSGGGIVAGTIVYETDTVAHSQYIGVSEEGRKVGALDCLFNWLIKDVYQQKKHFDFGICNEAEGRVLNHGMLSWKEGFGARCYAHDFYEILTETYPRLESALDAEPNS